MKRNGLNDTELADIILNNIQTERYGKGDKIPSVRQLSKMFNSSHVTVAKAVKKLVDQGDLISIHGKGSYVAEGFEDNANSEPSSSLSNFIPASNKIKQIYFMFTSNDMTQSSSQFEVFKAAQDFGQEYGISFKQVSARESNWLDDINAAETGIILNDPTNLNTLFKRGIPIVFFCSLSTLFHPVNSIMPNYNQGAQLLTEYLISKGHQNITFIDVDQRNSYTSKVDCADDFSMIERYYGYVQIMQEYGLSHSPPVPWHYLHNTTPVKSLLKAVKQQSPDAPTALVVSSDMMAYEIVGIATDMGINIPEDLSIVNIDTIGYTDICSPKLTTTIYNKKLKGRLAVELLLSQGAKSSAFQTNLLLPMELAEKESVTQVIHPEGNANEK